MRVGRLKVENFRGVRRGEITFQEHTLLVGGNNVGKSTVCEALDLVLGPERLYRRPVINEHDFFAGRYLAEDSAAIEVRTEAILTGLSDEDQRRFGSHLRLWDQVVSAFVDDEPGGVERSDRDGVEWVLPVVFIGRYDAEEDDFVGDTFFLHPEPVAEDLDDDEKSRLGGGLRPFTRSHKRTVGFVFLRALRTGSRALSLQRGSLLDTILRLGGDGSAEMWKDTLDRLSEMNPAIGDISQLKTVRESLRERLGSFVNLASSEPTAFFASDLTREHLREVVRLFIATAPSGHLVPFTRQGTGSINLLVFALLTIIAELKGSRSVIFAMEEPEIALPPHTQRRVTRFVLQQMGQSIVTSHSQHVIEQFDPESVVMLHRDGDELLGEPIDTTKVKPKTYRTDKRQFAEAILARAVLVVEGSTESVVFSAASAVLERVRPDYLHLDFSGVSIFTAPGDGSVARFGPVFKTLGKLTFGACDKPNAPVSSDTQAQRNEFDEFWESAESGIEDLLIKGVPTEVLRGFLDDVSTRADYPASYPYSTAIVDTDLPDLTRRVLKARKGEAYAYAAVLIDQCQDEADIPEEIRNILITMDEVLKAQPEEIVTDLNGSATEPVGDGV